jgi:hypothetical protein
LTAVPADPAVGDARITFTATHPADVSVVAGQVGDTFEAYPTEAGRPISLLSLGNQSAAAMFAAAEAANRTTTWILRAVGIVIMFIGLTMILRPMSVLADVVPFIGNLVQMGTSLVALMISLGISIFVIAVAWLFYRPLLGGCLLIVSIGFAFFLFRWLRQARSRAPEPAET